ncbi:hypothetical protein DDB_G0284965 [Dictyostelium discoideum AX4]|uniref:Uncharacterized protein n=1 Tax=Dictyostelium discoideum TaxID=44689 RepID=Q54NV8_DICDI|nr:hypothetical protein DDB_G0284965 [Dictyostelium discoideum AX4]EAL64946.1 hypothetical protein DDB_G0284965 [Dictyostelium discoideum AX4]|eukprot:XP_639959.1 hypothetical protein DDB_G0284965 [Dictyostelium discoideum AX4]
MRKINFDSSSRNNEIPQIVYDNKTREKFEFVSYNGGCNINLKRSDGSLFHPSAKNQSRFSFYVSDNENYHDSKEIEIQSQLKNEKIRNKKEIKEIKHHYLDKINKLIQDCENEKLTNQILKNQLEIEKKQIEYLKQKMEKDELLPFKKFENEIEIKKLENDKLLNQIKQIEIQNNRKLYQIKQNGKDKSEREKEKLEKIANEKRTEQTYVIESENKIIEKEMIEREKLKHENQKQEIERKKIETLPIEQNEERERQLEKAKREKLDWVRHIEKQILKIERRNN